MTEGTYGFVVDEEIVEVFHAGPGGGTVIGGTVVPAHNRGVVHGFCPGINALGSEIGAVTTNVFEIIIGRISAHRPSVGVSNGSSSIIRDYTHGSTSYGFILYYAMLGNTPHGKYVFAMRK